ncbi:hypothetical protein DFH28DRAFT_1117341 [Melampsora americana]|nr:hypothetical protein DFH28DRAFT_1117341 [Melampsora americana]
MGNNTTSTTTAKYPNPIPAPPLDQIFPNHEAAELYLHGFASDHGFQIGRLSTRAPTSVIFKCSEGPHRHMTQAKRRAIAGQSTLADPPLRTCPFVITSRRLKTDHSKFYLVIKPQSSTHDHGPQEDLPKKIHFIASKLTLATSTSLASALTSASTTSTSLPPPLIQHTPSQQSRLALPEPPAGLLTLQYEQLMQELQSLPKNTQAYLLNSFLRDCQLAQGITNSAISQTSSTLITESNKSTTDLNQSITNSNRSISTEDLPLHQAETEIQQSKSYSDASTIDQDIEADDIPLESHNKDPLIDPTLDKATLEEPNYPKPQKSSSPLPDEFDIITRLEQDEYHQKVEDKALQAVEEALEVLEHDLALPKLNDAEVDIPQQDTPLTSLDAAATPLDAPIDPPVALPSLLTDEKLLTDEQLLTDEKRPRKKGQKRKGPKAKPSINDELTPVAPPAPITRGRKRKLPKGWVYSAIDEVEMPTVELPKEKTVTERQNHKVGSSGRAPRASTRLKAATAAKDQLSVGTPSTTLTHPQPNQPRLTDSSVNLQSPPPIAETTAETTLYTSQSKRTARKKAKEKCQKPRTPEETEVDNQIEANLLKKWPFVDDLPRYIFPFIKNAIDVPKDGLCAFSSVAVCLGEKPDQAPIVRTAMSNHFHSRYEWYAKNMPKFAVNFDIEHIKRILDSTSLTAPFEDWFPMPMGGYLIANTYDRPVIFYSKSDAPSKLIPPCFTSYNEESARQPIAMGYIQDSHFISLELELNDRIPIPFLHPDWKEVRDPRAADWEVEYKMSIAIFTDLKWQREWIANQDGSYTNVSKTQIEIDQDDSEDNLEEQ